MTAGGGVMCAMKKVHHVVRRPGNRLGDPDIEIPVADDLVTEPGAPVREGDVSFYSREYPLEAHFVENSADREWLWSQYTESFAQWRVEHEKVDTPLVETAAVSGDIPPHGEPDPDLDPTEHIRRKARELGVQRGRLHKVRPPVHVRQQEEVGEVPARHLSRL